MQFPLHSVPVLYPGKFCSNPPNGCRDFRYSHADAMPKGLTRLYIIYGQNRCCQYVPKLYRHSLFKYDPVGTLHKMAKNRCHQQAHKLNKQSITFILSLYSTTGLKQPLLKTKNWFSKPIIT